MDWTTDIPPFEIAFRTVFIYLFILLGLRLAGKRHMGELSPYSLVLILLVSEAAQNAMSGGDESLTGGLIGIGSLLLLNYLIGLFASKSRRIDRFVDGRATILINRGKILKENMRRERVGNYDLREVLRENGVISPSHVRLAMLEVDGNISIIKYDDLRSH